MTTEQIIILGFFAAAFLAGWVARALVGRGSQVEVGAGPSGDRSEAQRFGTAVHLGRSELARATRAYHAAVVRTFGNGKEAGSSEGTLEALASALESLSLAVDHASKELEEHHPLTARLQSTGVELHRLADDVMRHSREDELPAGVFDQLEQHLISAASMIFTPDPPQPRAA